MEPKLQTAPNDQNRMVFYQQVYHHQTLTKDQLINLDHLTESNVIMIDCCGWHYKNIFPEKNIVGLEAFSAFRNFRLDKTYFDKLFDDQNNSKLTWPNCQLNNCAVVFDRSTVLKYCSLEKISKVLSDVVAKYEPSTVMLKQSLTFTDDIRTVDRFYHISQLLILDYFVKTFEYNTDLDYWYVVFQKKVSHDT
jgi:hypothetical protein